MEISITRYPANVDDISDLLTDASRRLIEQNAIAVESALESAFRELLYTHLHHYQRGEYDATGDCVDAILADFKALIRSKIIVTET